LPSASAGASGEAKILECVAILRYAISVGQARQNTSALVAHD
jgi:hypothetical protein